MPSLPKRPCTYPGGCSALVDGGAPGLRCPAHPRPVQTEREKRAGKTTAQRGYDATHKRLKVLAHVRDRWRCVDCGWEPELVRTFREAGMGTPSTERVLEALRVAYAAKERHLHADHHFPIEDKPELANVLDNYRTRCNVCHNRKTASEDHGFGR
jgi:hypothetical protein